MMGPARGPRMRTGRNVLLVKRSTRRYVSTDPSTKQYKSLRAKINKNIKQQQRERDKLYVNTEPSTKQHKSKNINKQKCKATTENWRNNLFNLFFSEGKNVINLIIGENP